MEIERIAVRGELFQSTPPAEARGDALWISLEFQCRSEGDGSHSAVAELFQSTPPAEARGDRAFQVVSGCPVMVSIHSPRRSEGRPRLHEADASEAELFQSTPPAEARGDGDRHWYRGPGEHVSIHSPRRSEGRQPTPEGRIQQ